MVDEGGAERRRDSRFGTRIDVRFALVADAARALNTFSMNFSAGGLCLRTRTPHQVGEHLEIDVTIEGHQFRLEAEVAWVRGAAMGVRFTNVSPADRERLETVARTLEERSSAPGMRPTEPPT